MAKLYFRYAAMGGGKTLHLLQVVDNYERIGKKCLVTKPLLDDKAGTFVESRLGLSRHTDFLIGNDFSVDYIKDDIEKAHCIVCDEAQFLTEDQVWKLYEITKDYDLPVICYGLRTRVNGKPFQGSTTLMAIADDIEEIKTVCECGKKATFQVRYINNELDMGDVEIVIDKPENHVEYVNKCGDCFVALKREYENRG